MSRALLLFLLELPTFFEYASKNADILCKSKNVSYFVLDKLTSPIGPILDTKNIRKFNQNDPCTPVSIWEI